jgi:hypothetical protein
MKIAISEMLDDFAEVRAILAMSALVILTVLVWTNHIGGTIFGACFTTVFGCYTAHSCIDDKLPDRPGIQQREHAELVHDIIGAHP